MKPTSRIVTIQTAKDRAERLYRAASTLTDAIHEMDDLGQLEEGRRLFMIREDILAAAQAEELRAR